MSHAPTVAVSDFLSNHNDQLVTAAKIVGRSKDRQKVFEAVYKGKTKIKTVDYIKSVTGLSQVRVLQEGGKMAPHLMEKVNGGYKKKPEFSTRYRNILVMARDRKMAEKLATKVKPHTGFGKHVINISFPTAAARAESITIDDIDSFSKVRGSTVVVSTNGLAEEKIKHGFQDIVGDTWTFKDWGGERSDLYTTKFLLKGKRIPTAIAFKGKGTSGKLVPGKMGKNGDQVGRLFSEPAQLFLVVYNGQIDSSVISQMKAFAIANALGGTSKVYFGIVDGSDLARLMAVYPTSFK
jgi:hypothetical protein